MRSLLIYILCVCGALAAGDSQYPLREPKDGEGRPMWWWAIWRDPVIVVRGSVAETEKVRPDLSVTAPWDTWRKLTAPSLANKPTLQGAHFLVTDLKISEVVYVDPALAKAHADFARIAEGSKRETSCILPTEIHDRYPDSETEEGWKRYSDNPVQDVGLEAKFVYRCDELHGRGDDEQILVFQYSRLYPVEALVLYAVTSLDDLEEAKRVAEHRRNANKAAHTNPLPAEESKSEGSEKPKSESEGRSR